MNVFVPGLKFIGVCGATGTHMPNFMHKLCSTAIKESLGECAISSRQKGRLQVLDTAHFTDVVRRMCFGHKTTLNPKP